MSVKPTKKRSLKIYHNTCTSPTHAEGKCPATELDCFDCGKVGHFSGSKACKKNKEFKSMERKKRRKFPELGRYRSLTSQI